MQHNRVVIWTVLLVAMAAGGVQAETTMTGERAAWLLDRATGPIGGVSDWDQDEFTVSETTVTSEENKTHRKGSGLNLLASVILPGSGEAMMGYKRGYVMMAVDIFAWIMVSQNHQDGKDLADEYYVFADAHWSEDLLVEGYNRNPTTDQYRRGLGLDYFPNDDGAVANDPSELGNVLPLWVSREDDEREYYENLGKWDQFVFGWDDFVRPDDSPGGDYVPDGSLSDLRQPWTSYNRAKYREMRDASNDAYETRDQWLYVNIGLRVFSVLQVAYLQGLLFGSEDGMQVAGHDIQLITQPVGFHSGQVAASVSF